MQSLSFWGVLSLNVCNCFCCHPDANVNFPPTSCHCDPKRILELLEVITACGLYLTWLNE